VALPVRTWSQGVASNSADSQLVTIGRRTAVANNGVNVPGEKDTIDVVGHIALPGVVASTLVVSEDVSHAFVEVVDNTHNTIEVVDVTDPGRPILVRTIERPASLENARLETEVGDAALFIKNDAVPPALSTSVSIVSLHDPNHPTTLREFRNVSALQGDHVRGLIYLATTDTLWILQPHSAVDSAAQAQAFEEMFRAAIAP
jgi:hypothetical protein